MNTVIVQSLPNVAGKSNVDVPSKNGAKPKAASQTVKPVKFRFHVDGSISVRVDGRWHHGQELDQRLYLSFPGEIRRQIMKRIVALEYADGRSRIEGSAVVVSREVR